MTLMTYDFRDLSDAYLDVIVQANEILEDMGAQGYTLTLRQLYYQFVSKDLIPNTLQSYKRLGEIVSRGRLAGMISWHHIEDRNRSTRSYYFEEETSGVVRGLDSLLAIDFWARQPAYVEVWIEKDALSGIISNPCERRRVPYLACKGYLSQSEAWRAGQRFQEAAEAGKECILLHLGDHDPSGIDMTRDNADRVRMFAEGAVEVKRLALNMDQVEEIGPPPNHTKISDSRAPAYVDRFGSDSWELDALPPRYIDQLVTREIEALIDYEAWTDCIRLQRERRKTLTALEDNWIEIERTIRNNYL